MTIRLDEVSALELRSMMFRAFGAWPALGMSKSDMISRLKTNYPQLPKNEVDDMREIVTKYLHENVERLAVRCDGNCWKHPDAVVVACYNELLSAQNEEAVDEKNK